MIIFKSNVEIFLSPPQGAYLFQAHLRVGGGGLFWAGDLFNFKKTMESVLHKELEYKVEIKAQVQAG